MNMEAVGMILYYLVGELVEILTFETLSELCDDLVHKYLVEIRITDELEFMPDIVLIQSAFCAKHMNVRIPL